MQRTSDGVERGLVHETSAPLVEALCFRDLLLPIGENELLQASAYLLAEWKAAGYRSHNRPSQDRGSPASAQVADRRSEGCKSRADPVSSQTGLRPTRGHQQAPEKTRPRKCHLSLPCHIPSRHSHSPINIRSGAMTSPTIRRALSVIGRPHHQNWSPRGRLLNMSR